MRNLLLVALFAAPILTPSAAAAADYDCRWYHWITSPLYCATGIGEPVIIDKNGQF